MELQYKKQTLQNNLMGASYASGGLQGHTWEFQWGPQGLEQAIKRVGMNPVITQNFSTDPMGRILTMTYDSATYTGEPCFHYDVQGNTSLLTDSNGQAVASFRYDLHSGGLVEYWNPSNLELVNLELAEQGGIRIEVVARGELIIQPVMPPALIELWVPLHLRSGPGSLPPGHFLPPGMTIYEYWMMLYRMGLIDQMPEGGRYDDPFGGLTHQAPGESGGLRLYDPNRVYISSRGRSWKNYENCVINCFAGVSTVNKMRLLSEPSAENKTAWKNWMQWRRNIFSKIATAGIGVAILLIAYYLTGGGALFVGGAAVLINHLANLGFTISVQVSDIIELFSSLPDSFHIKFRKEMECRAYCNKFSPDPSRTRYWFLYT